MFQARTIPNSREGVCSASAHHGVTGEPVCVLDPAADPDSQVALARIAPGPYPEAESGNSPEPGPWQSAARPDQRMTRHPDIPENNVARRNTLDWRRGRGKPGAILGTVPLEDEKAPCRPRRSETQRL